MKYCLSCFQNVSYLKEADEIKVPWARRNKIPELIEYYPDKIFIVQHLYSGKYVDWDEYEKLYDQCDDALVIALNNVRDCIEAAKRDLPYYYGYPISTYEEFNSLVELEPFYIIPGAPLFFDLEYISSKGVPLRAFPNVSSMSLFPKINNYSGTWIRPEDIDFYSRYIETCEFFTETIEQERALFRIYKRDKEFIGPIGLIIPDLMDSPAHNDLINPEYISVRTYCKQRCESGEKPCNICERLLYLADPEIYKPFLDQTTQTST